VRCSPASLKFTSLFNIAGVVILIGVSLSACTVSMNSSSTSAGTTSSTTTSSSATDQLVFTTEPSSSATAGAVLGTQPVVTVQIISSLTTDTSYTSTIALSVYSDSACSSAVGSGTLSGSATTLAGVASFSGVSFTHSGTIYLGQSDFRLLDGDYPESRRCHSAGLYHSAQRRSRRLCLGHSARHHGRRHLWKYSDGQLQHGHGCHRDESLQRHSHHHTNCRCVQRSGHLLRPQHQ
jgi:hypothetical protein